MLLAHRNAAQTGVDRFISNQSLAMVGAVESLVYLSLANCSGFTDAGLANLNNLKQLKHLVLPTFFLHAAG